MLNVFELKLLMLHYILDPGLFVFRGLTAERKEAAL